MGLIQASNFPNLTRHKSVCSSAIASKFYGMTFTALDNNIVTKSELNCFITHMHFKSCKIGCVYI